MQTRREFFQAASLTTLASVATQPLAAEVPTSPTSDREFWLRMLQRVAEPVLTNFAANRLRERMPVEAPGGNASDRRKYTHLEALGRTLSGIGPWLELPGKTGPEAALSAHFAEAARLGIAHATDPQAPDFLNFTTGAQPLVDAAFLAQGILRSRKELWERLEPAVQRRLVDALQGVRRIRPGRNNWLLFSAMVEAFLARIGADWSPDPIEAALAAHEQWYKGDGIYGDGEEFHWDYYNSYVIHPFLVDVLEHIGSVTSRWAGRATEIHRRARRFAAVQERMIAPDGSFPVLGRSIAYRCGAFHALAQSALRQDLPPDLAAPQVRSALTAVIRRTLEAPGTFDTEGWLRIGLAGHQPSLAEGYISTGSLYLCSTVFLPLGLPADHPFWSGPAADWTSRKLWAGADAPADHALGKSG